jgi:3-oxoadipate enol-lactonase
VNDLPPAASETVAAAAPGAPWLTLLHGMSQDRRVFSAQVDAFAGRYRLLLVDLPGHGRSAGMPGPYGLAEYAAAVRSALRAAGIARTHLWGTHTGAAIGLMLADAEPALCASLVLEGPVLPGRPPAAVSEMLAQVAALARAQGLAAARAHWWEHSGWFAVMRARPEACRAAEHRALVEQFPGAPWIDARPPAPVAPLDERLPRLRTPALIVNGEHDLPEFLAAAAALAAVLPRARRVSIPDAGGFPLWEFPARVNDEVARFLDER